MGGAAVIAAGAALTWMLRASPEAEPVPEGMVLDEDGQLVDRRELFEADLEAQRQAALPKSTAAMILSTLEGAGPGAAPLSDVDAARDGFSTVIAELERLAERPRAMRQSEWQAAYRAANDAFSALSTQLDAKDPTQAKELEAAHKQLVTALSIVRVRGGKFRNR